MCVHVCHADHFRAAGDVSYTDVDRNGGGIVEFRTKSGACACACRVRARVSARARARVRVCVFVCTCVRVFCPCVRDPSSSCLLSTHSLTKT